jgi:FRG domain-containing protein
VWLALLAAGWTELWAYMQHHGSPTRLLDWTASAYVAAYFAVDQFPDCDGAIFVVAPKAIDAYVERCNPQMAEITDDQLVDPSTPERVLFTWPHFMSRRVVAQQGHFNVSTKILSTHDHFILEACSNVAEDREEHIIQRKVVIAADLKLVILQQLRAMNIAPHALFPSLDGLGKSLSDLERLRAALVGGTG